jgi:hypothetical protein
MSWQRLAGGILVAVAVVLGLDILVCRHAPDPPRVQAHDDVPTRTTADRPTAPQLPPSVTAPADPAEPKPPPPAIATDQAQAKLADEALEPVRDAFLADLTAQAKAQGVVVRLGIDRRGSVLLVTADGGCTDHVLRTLHDLVDRARAKTAGLAYYACGSGAAIDL